MSKVVLYPVSIDTLEDFGFQSEGELPPRWKEYKWNEASAKRSRDLKKQLAFYRITKGSDWSLLDDLARGAVGDDVAYGSGWSWTTQASLERLKLLFRMLRLDNRLELRENPEWTTPYDPREAKAGVRAARKKLVV